MYTMRIARRRFKAERKASIPSTDHGFPVVDTEDLRRCGRDGEAARPGGGVNAPDNAPEALDDRFWSKVDKSGGPDACWPWTAGKHQRGYGIYSAAGRVSRRAHKMALEESLGRRLLPGELARHAVCDNPPCCNPAHLSPGSHQDNRDDCVGRGRQAKGGRCGTPKLTADKALAIRARATAGESPTALGREFGVRKYVVQQIRDGKAWRHV